MKNSQVNDWNGFAKTLVKNGTKHLDLRKMLGQKNSEELWRKFNNTIGTVQNLETIDLCKCPSSVVESLFTTNTNLKVINALTIENDQISLEKIANLKSLEEFRIKTATGSLDLISNLSPLKELTNIRHLSLTNVRELGTKTIETLGKLINLESLELGECCELTENFVEKVLPNLTKLERLRLEKGQDQCCTFKLLIGISKMVALIQLELINFDIRAEFDEYLSHCKNIKKLLLIPTYISQSATTDHIVLAAVMKLSETLTTFTWVVTSELVRVTELYVEKTLTDCIPVLKPVPGILETTRIMSKRSKFDVPKVEILELVDVEIMLNTALPNTKVKIVIIPYHATWRQNLVEGQ